MPYHLHWTGQQMEEASADYRPAVAERLRDVLEDKERQLRSVQNPADLGRRFHNMFTLAGLKVAEIRFSVHGQEFRAICVVLHDIQTVVYHTLTDKGNQEQTLAEIRNAADKIESAIRSGVPSELL